MEIKTGWDLEAQSLGRFAGSGVVQFAFSVTGGGGFGQSLGFGVDVDGVITGDNGQTGGPGTRIIKTGPPMGGVVDGGSIVTAIYVISGQMTLNPTGQYHAMHGGNFEGGPLMANCVEPAARLKLMVRPLRTQPAQAKTWRGGKSIQKTLKTGAETRRTEGRKLSVPPPGQVVASLLPTLNSCLLYTSRCV